MSRLQAPLREASPSGRTGGARPFREREVAVPVTMAASAAALVWGWSIREELLLSPESGLGYWLGITGTAFMVLLLGYSIRKRISVSAPLGSIRSWFTFHMVLGLLAPAAILFHANFHLGSLNSTVALFCVLVVAGSGIVGRVIYPKVYVGLAGRRATLLDLKTDAKTRRGSLGVAITAAPRLERVLREFESSALANRREPKVSILRLFAIGSLERRARRRCLRLLKNSPLGKSLGKRRMAGMNRAVCAYLGAVRSVAELRAYERIFSVWHALHLPLFFILFAAATVHVIAVHMY